MTRIITLFACTLIFCSSCLHFGGTRVKGNGNMKKSTRAIKSFSRLEVSSALEVHFKQDSTTTVEIETDENLHEYIFVQNEGEELAVQIESGFNLDPSSGSRVRIYISSPNIQELRVSGASRLIGENQLTGQNLFIDLSGASQAELDLRYPRTEVELSGACKLTLQGETKDLSVSGSGASHAHCFELHAENVSLDVSGASSADVYASVTVDASASGASHISYKGGGKPTKTDASGASKIEKVD